jgi:predicted  nucleic acid-binding Zn-ribbon protein
VIVERFGIGEVHALHLEDHEDVVAAVVLGVDPALQPHRGPGDEQGAGSRGRNDAAGVASTASYAVSGSGSWRVTPTAPPRGCGRRLFRRTRGAAGRLSRVNAEPADQRRLLDLSELDARIRRAEKARTHPPQAARVQELLSQRTGLVQELSNRANARDDLRTELSRIESDVAVVDARSARDSSRLATSSNAKEAQGLESEIAALARRKSDLEDAELIVMERLETAEAAVAEQEAIVASTNDEGARLSAEAKTAVADATRDLEAAQRDRAAVAAAIAPDLVALYERTSARGNGAGHLHRGTCESCRMVLSGTDMNKLRQAPDDLVVNCPECGAILVRTEESGLW